MMKSVSLLALTIGALAMTACSPKSSPTNATTTTESAAAIMTAEEASQVMAQSGDPGLYTGKWTGPEGTDLLIAARGGGYDVTITNLDGPRTFAGELQADGMHVTRDGKLLIIHPGSGHDTGMKWLVGKSDCLVVAPNEGYCRS